MDPRNDLDDIYDDPEGRAFRVAHASRWRCLGKDPITGSERWHHHEVTELTYSDGSREIFPD